MGDLELSKNIFFELLGMTEEEYKNADFYFIDDDYYYGDLLDSELEGMGVMKLDGSYYFRVDEQSVDSGIKSEIKALSNLIEGGKFSLEKLEQQKTHLPKKRKSFSTPFIKKEIQTVINSIDKISDKMKNPVIRDILLNAQDQHGLNAFSSRLFVRRGDAIIYENLELDSNEFQEIDKLYKKYKDFMFIEFDEQENIFCDALYEMKAYLESAKHTLKDSISRDKSLLIDTMLFQLSQSWINFGFDVSFTEYQEGNSANFNRFAKSVFDLLGLNGLTYEALNTRARRLQDKGRNLKDYESRNLIRKI